MLFHDNSILCSLDDALSRLASYRLLDKSEIEFTELLEHDGFGCFMSFALQFGSRRRRLVTGDECFRQLNEPSS